MKQNLLQILLLLFLSSLFSINIMAQDGGEPSLIAYDETKQATLAEGVRDFWTFSGQAGDTITITMTSEVFDPYLRLFDPNGVEIGFNDDSPYRRGTEAVIGVVLLTEAGNYTIEARATHNRSAGAYTLQLDNNAIVLDYAAGTQVSAMMSHPDGDQWQFEGQAGDTINIAAPQIEFDFIIRLFTPDGTELHAIVGTNTVILPQTGLYTMQVIDRDSVIGRPYTFELTQFERAYGTTLQYGDRVEARLEGDPSIQQWQFEGEAGETIVITMESTDFNPAILLYGPSSDLLADIDTFEDDEIRVGPLPLNETGIYTIVAQRYESLLSFDDTFRGGDYTLYVGRADIVPRPPLEYGQREVGELLPGLSDRWVFEGNAGDQVRIFTTSDDVNVSVRLLDVFDKTLDAGEGVEDGDWLVGPVTLPQTGTYAIVVNNRTDFSGKYLIGIEQVPPEVQNIIIYGEAQDVMLTDGRDTWVFEADAGDIVTITMSSDDFDAFLLLQDLENSYLTSNDDFDGLNAQIGPILLTQTGTYTIVVSSAGNAGQGAYTLAVDLQIGN